jgi:hypothetical protein
MRRGKEMVNEKSGSDEKLKEYKERWREFGGGGVGVGAERWPPMTNRSRGRRRRSWRQEKYQSSASLFPRCQQVGAPVGWWVIH